MAAASPTFPISRETTNYARLCVLLVDVGSQVLRETFDRIRPRGPLDTVLGTPPTSIRLTSLLRRKVVNPSQWKTLYPAIKSSVSSENFDITLLMVLLRNICGLTPPAAGWDALPSPTDVNCEDDLARIKYYRNTVYGHAAQASVDDTKFNDYWMNIHDTLVRLGGADYQAPIDGLQYACIDRDTEERYIEMLKKWKVDEDVIGHVLKDKIDNVEAKVDKVQASVNNVEAKVDNFQAVVDRIETQLVPTPVTICVVNNIESINLGGRVINVRDLANSCRMHQAAGRSGGMIIIPVAQDEQEQVEGVEGTVSGQSQGDQQYVPTENDIWEVVLSFKNCLNTFLNYLKNKLQVLVRGHHLGSLLITTECSSLQILERLWKDYTSGHLQEVAQDALLTSDVLKTVGVTGIKLKTFVSEEEYEKGKNTLVENLGEPDTETVLPQSMDSSGPMSPSTGKTTNYARLCRLLVDVGSMVLRETFHKTRPPGGLDTVLGSPSVSATLQSLRRKNILNPLQWNKLYPAIKSSLSSEKFDISLLIVLLRSICGLTPPATGWDNLPLPTDLSCEADIARIKFYRNTLYALAQASVDDATFDHYWANIRDTLVRRGGAAYETAIDDLRYDHLDSDMEEHYKEHLKQWTVDEDIIKDKLDNAEVKKDEQKPPINDLEKQSQPTSEETKKSITRSELPVKESNIYGRTREIESIVQALSEKCGENVAGVVISGTAGVGKSTVAIQAGYRLKNEFEAIVKFCSLRGAGSGEDDRVVREILNVCVPGHQQGSEYPKHVLLNWCRQLENEMILIVDNVEDAIGGRDKYSFLNLLSEMRMRSDCKTKFLITSSWDIETAGTVSNIPLLKISLGPLDVKESVEVLKNAANLTSAETEPKTEVKLHEIAELCENIPLALRLAGPLLAVDSEYTFNELKRKLEKNPTSILGVKPIMEIAFEKLEESLQRALVYLSVFPQSFKRDAAEAILGDTCAEALTNLKKSCLIQKQGDRYLIHLLIRSYTKQIGQRKEFGQILADGKQGYNRHFLSLILRNAQIYWTKDTCKESLKMFNEERINLEFILREVANGQKKFQNCKELEDVVDSCSQVALYIEDCVPFKLYGDFLNGLLQCSQRQEKITKQVEILCLLYDESRRHGGEMEKSKDLINQAIKLHDSHLPVFEQNSLSEAFYLSHYGRYLSQDCEMRVQAQPFLEKAISIVEEETVEHASTFDIGRVLAQMGHNARLGKLENADTRYKKALTYFQKALRFRQFRYGEHVVTALAHKDVAGAYLSIEDFGKAEENYEAAVQIFECMGMMKQKEAIPTYKNYARCCEKSGKIDEARRKLEMAIEVADTTIEGSHKWKVEINTNLALILFENYPNEVGKAEELSKDVFHMAQELKIVKWHQSKKLKTLILQKEIEM